MPGAALITSGADAGAGYVWLPRGGPELALRPRRPQRRHTSPVRRDGRQAGLRPPGPAEADGVGRSVPGDHGVRQGHLQAPASPIQGGAPPQLWRPMHHNAGTGQLSRSQGPL